MLERVEKLMEGAIDIQVHTNPAIRERLLDSYEAAVDAKSAGMKGIVLKDLNTLSANVAYLVNKRVEGVEVWGGVVLDYSVGGINPAAVETAVSYGAKVVWMPCTDSANTIEKTYVTGETKKAAPMIKIKDPAKGLSIFEGGMEGSKILPEVREVISLVAKHNIILETGHLSPREIIELTKEARKMGVNKIVVTHVNSGFIGATIHDKEEMIKAGAYLCYTYDLCLPTTSRQNSADLVEEIKKLGVENCILATNMGQLYTIRPVEGLKLAITDFLRRGMSDEEIEVLVKLNPSKLLDLV
ncbi:MAG: hypothetical protein J7L41_04560 [Synergistetes bacterium]|nr:hypothetical protein [Synergistota bacterium]